MDSRNFSAYGLTNKFYVSSSKCNNVSSKSNTNVYSLPPLTGAKYGASGIP
jgi:hypothetical protein